MDIFTFLYSDFLTLGQLKNGTAYTGKPGLPLSTYLGSYLSYRNLVDLVYLFIF